MAKKATVYACTECGNQTARWLGRCPEGNAWSSYVQEDAPGDERPSAGLSSGGARPMPIDAIDADVAPRVSTNLPNFDRVLGGGLVLGAVTLVGGEPGIGKSTLLLQAAQQLAKRGAVLYVSGEESPRQIALRARRLGTTSDNIRIYTETSVERIVAEVEAMLPVAVIVDSIQTVHTTASDSMPGSVAQVRDSAGVLMTLAKRLSIPIFLIGHITKEGTIAGPKSLEHIVDTVLYFEGDKFQNYRVVRAYKNRFGPVNEVAIYEMHDGGLEEVPNASATPFPSPRRMAMGIDANRVSLLLAVLEKKSGGNFISHDVYVNLAGGLQVSEPAIDLGVVAALLSSQRNAPTGHDG